MTERSTWPSDEEVHEDLMEQLKLGIHVAMPGRIQSYDAARQVADIVLQLQHTYPDPEGSGEYLHEDYPVLPAVPVLWPRMGKWFMAASVEPGDAVQVLFNSSAIGLWRRSNATTGLTGLDRALRGVSLVGDVGRHHLTHAVALLGLETYDEALAHAPPQREPASALACMTLGSDLDAGTRISIYGDNTVKITRGDSVVVQIDADGTVHLGGAAGNFVALANLVNSRLSDIRSAFNDHTHLPGTLSAPSGGGSVTGASGAPSSELDELASVAATKAKAV